MLERQLDEVKDLLLRTSLLDRVNGELADLLTGRTGSERILLALEDANAFVVSLDRERRWFRYHHLFADLLRLELRRALPEEVPALHRRAAAWFIGAGPGGGALRATPGAGGLAAGAPGAARPVFRRPVGWEAHSVPGACRRRTPPPGRGRPGPADRPALPGSPVPGAARVRLQDPPVRHCPAALPGGDSTRRATRLVRGAVDRARAGHVGGGDGVGGPRRAARPGPHLARGAR